MQAKSYQPSAISNIEALAKLMDSQFTIPGTKITFGLDAIIGLVPGAGDFATFLISGYMVMILAKNGANGFVLARMTFNILIDALIGSIPILGDLFDVAFRANQRNVKLMREHYIEGRHKGGAWKLVVPLLLSVLLVIAALAWVSYKAYLWLFT
jgi:hypothetical protein